MPERRILERDGLARRRLASRLVPGLPVDADPVELRHSTPSVGGLMKSIVDELLMERNPFFDTVSSQWAALCPGIAARPGRFENGRLFLYVRSSAALFAIRPKLRKVKTALSALPEAPARFSVHLEIHA